MTCRSEACPRLTAQRSPKHPENLALSISVRPNNRRAGLAIIAKSYSNAFQISVAYSRMVRSDENQPIRELLNTAERHHSLESCQ